MTHLELFAGVGGFRTAMDHIQQDLGMLNEVIGFSEIDNKATITYKANYDTANEIEVGDIVAFINDRERFKNLPPFNLLTGGFPCQTFSMMGSQAGFNEDRGQMFFRIMDIIQVRHPRYILLENVKNLYRHDNGNTYARIEQELQNEGYHVFPNIFNTADFHLPQKRSRVLIFATTEAVPDNFAEIFTPENVKSLFDENYLRLGVSHYETTLDILDEHVEPKYFLSERLKPTILADGSANFKSRSDINQLIARTLTASMHKMHRACQDNYFSQDFIESKGAINHVLDYTKEQLARLDIRKLTPQEAFMLQGFPAQFATNSQNAGVSNGSLYKQAGNAVSVNVIYAVLYYLIINNIIYE